MTGGPGAVGAVFTPPEWAAWALERLDAPARVAAGATFCDPTAGEGAFAWALAGAWTAGRGSPDPAWVRRITLIEREGRFLEAFARKWRERWGSAFPEANLIEADVVTTTGGEPFDLVAGNPPWITYPDLTDADKALYRPWFASTGLVGRPSELLLGRSRLDLAALVTARVLEARLADGGQAGFFLPLSLFQNSGAPALWREKWPAARLFDLSEARPFPQVGTRCAWAEFSPGTAFPEKPVRFTGRPGAWTEPPPPFPGPVLEVATWQKPRQGINTGGLNAAFHTDRPPDGVDPAFVHPLSRKTGRWILVPYRRDGTILDASALRDSGLEAHWAPWKEALAARRGVLLGAQLGQGRWWALLGVGGYAFAPYKVIWSAYGKHKMDAAVWGPRDDGAVWQADQALQAYLPAADEDDARRICHFLNGPEVGRYLKESGTGGTPSWAQPGRIRGLLRFRPGTDTPGGATGN